MKKLTVEVGFTTDPNWEVDQFKLEFSKEVLISIRKYQAYLEANSDIFKIVINFDGESCDSDGKKSDFKSDGGELYIFKDSVYYFTQSKYDATYQYESQEIPNSDLFT